jgi:hypothetical protein
MPRMASSVVAEELIEALILSGWEEVIMRSSEVVLQEEKAG